MLQPILVRPIDENRFQLIAGERRWRASKIAGTAHSIPALVEDIDDDTALEISIIENLQREDISPLDEAAMYDRMIRDHGYSIRQLAEKLGKDKGYLENRLRLADAPAEVRELVSLRKDTPVPRLRADEGRGPEEAPAACRAGRPRTSSRWSSCASGSRVAARPTAEDVEPEAAGSPGGRPATTADEDWAAHQVDAEPIRDDRLVVAKRSSTRPSRICSTSSGTPRSWRPSAPIDRTNLAKYLTIAKLRLENAIAVVRSGDADR